MNFSTASYLFRYGIFKPGAMQAYRDALINEKLTPDELDNLNWKKTQKLLQHAHANVPYYRAKFKSIGLHPNDIKEPKNYNQVPILSRDNLIANYDALYAEGGCRSFSKVSTTGGSTGVPVKVGEHRKVIREVSKWQMLSWWGLSPATNMATIYRKTPITFLEKLALSFVNWPWKVIRGDASHLSKAEIEKFISAYRKLKPELLHGYAGALDTVANHLLHHEIFVPPPKVVWSTAAPLSKVQEETISKAFGAPICDQYGCSEVYFIAAECPVKDGLHIFSNSRRVEFVDDNDMPVPDMTYGRVIVTNLDEYCFPLIRYANGDMGRTISGRCPCGRNLPRIDKVRGRTSDRIVLPDGTVIAGEYLTQLFDDWTDEVARYQIVQTKAGTIEVRVVFRDSAKQMEEVLRMARFELAKRICNQVNLDVKTVADIPAERGKLQYIIREQ